MPQVKSKKLKGFKLSVLFLLTGSTKKIFTIPSVQNDMTVQNVRSNIELISGIPYQLQRLRYIDDG